MKIAIFGLGYVGIATATCLANDGHHITGVDVVDFKVDMINSGQSLIMEAGINELLPKVVASGNLVAVSDVDDAIRQTDMCFVCVGTPSLPNGSVDLGNVSTVCQQIGKSIRTRNNPYLVVIRSTVTPGSMEKMVIPVLEQTSESNIGEKFELLFHPEFLREGSSVEDFYAPSKIVVGQRYHDASQPLLDIYSDNYSAPRIVCKYEVAETVKYCDNIFHAMKVTFANEIGQFCRAQGIDSQEVMSIFCQDSKLNISDNYLRPGFAFGGSCLPKDLRAFLATARELDLQLPLTENILASNQKQIERSLEAITGLSPRKIGLYGLAFKNGTDDLRESPSVEVAERLIGKGYQLVIYDKFVYGSRLIGQNKSYIEQKLPHLGGIIVESLEEFDDCDVIIVIHKIDHSQLDLWVRSGRKVIDFSGNVLQNSDNYYKIV